MENLGAVRQYDVCIGDERENVRVTEGTVHADLPFDVLRLLRRLRQHLFHRVRAAIATDVAHLVHEGEPALGELPPDRHLVLPDVDRLGAAEATHDAVDDHRQDARGTAPDAAPAAPAAAADLEVFHVWEERRKKKKAQEEEEEEEEEG